MSKAENKEGGLKATRSSRSYDRVPRLRRFRIPYISPERLRANLSARCFVGFQEEEPSPTPAIVEEPKVKAPVKKENLIPVIKSVILEQPLMMGPMKEKNPAIFSSSSSTSTSCSSSSEEDDDRKPTLLPSPVVPKEKSNLPKSSTAAVKSGPLVLSDDEDEATTAEGHDKLPVIFQSHRVIIKQIKQRIIREKREREEEANRPPPEPVFGKPLEICESALKYLDEKCGDFGEGEIPRKTIKQSRQEYLKNMAAFREIRKKEWADRRKRRDHKRNVLKIERLLDEEKEKQLQNMEENEEEMMMVEEE